MTPRIIMYFAALPKDSGLSHPWPDCQRTTARLPRASTLEMYVQALYLPFLNPLARLMREKKAGLLQIRMIQVIRVPV